MADITLIRGDDEVLTITFTDADGAPINITGYTVYFTVKRQPDYRDNADDDDALIKIDQADHSAPAATNATTITIPKATMDVIEEGDYSYDIQIKDGGGLISTATPGTVRVLADITRRTT